MVIADPPAGIWMYVLFGIYGFSAYPIYAIAVAHANDFAKDGEFAKVAGGMLVVLGVGLAIGPALASMVMNVFKPVGFFIVTASFHAALALTAFVRMRARASRTDKAPFHPMQSDKPVTPESVALDPRAEETQENLPREDRDVQE